MVDLRGIHASLFVTLLLQFTAGETGQNETSVIVGAGGEVTLPCGNVTEHQDRCEGTSWIYSHGIGETAKELINLGKVQTTTIPQTMYNRLSLTSTCSLVIKNVMADDRGRFICRQFDKSRKQQGEDAPVFLSVLVMEKHRVSDSVSLFCSVLTYIGCRYTVKWLYDDGDVNVTETLPAKCSSRITLKSQFNKMSIKCSVTDDQTGQTLLCDVDSQSSCEETAKGNTTPEIQPGANNDLPPPDCSVVNYLMLVLRAAQLVLVTVITVLLVRAQRNQRAPEGNTVHRGDDAVTYENFGDDSASVRLNIKSAKK